MTWPPNGSCRIRAKQKLNRKHKGACKSSWSQIGSLKSFTLTFFGIWQSLWRSFLESSYVNTTQIGKKWDCWKSSAQSERRYFLQCCLQSGLNENWWGDSMECYTYLRNIQDLLSDGQTPYERAFWRTILKDKSFLLLHWLSITAKDQSKIHQFGKNVLPGLFLGYALYVEGWHNGCRHWGVGNDGRIGNLLEKTQCERGDISPKRRIYFSNRRWANQNPWRRSGIENIHLDTGPPNSRRRSKRFSWRIRRVSTFTTSRLISGCRWSKKWFLVHVRKLHFPPSRWTWSLTLLAGEKNHSLFHWNTLTSPELHIPTWMLCKIAAATITGTSDGPRDLSDPWTGFTQFTLLEEKPPNGFLWSGCRLERNQLTSRPDHLWNSGEECKRTPSWGRKHKCAIQKPKLDNAGRLRGIYFIDPEDKEFKETIKNAGRKWKHQWLQPCLARHTRKTSMARPVVTTHDFKSKFACVLEASESTRLRMEYSLPNYHEGHIAGKGDN